MVNKHGVFVTLYQNSRLRGCIGQFQSSLSLEKLVSLVAIQAGTEDPRFPPLKLTELNSIKIEISVLSACKKINHWQEIKLGKQGVLIKKGNISATFLPQVAQETGWTLEEFLEHLCRDKAGLSQDCYLDPQTEIFVYDVKILQE